MDVLTDILSATHLGNSLLCGGNFNPPWDIEFDSVNRTNFHIVTGGTCWAHFDDNSSIQLFQGDIILIPNGGKYIFTDQIKRPLTSKQNGNHNGVNDVFSTTLICGGYSFEHDRKHPLLSLLPDFIHIKANQIGNSDSLQTVVRLMSNEIQNKPVGSDIVMSRLVDILLVSILRNWINSNTECSAGWLTALKDSQIGKSLSLMHKDPTKKWTVEKLAVEVGMSRAAFAKKFSQLVGVTPITYLNQWRMDVAAKNLRETIIPIFDIAEQAGQKSESSFNKAFTKSRGMPPGKYRKINKKIHEL